MSAATERSRLSVTERMASAIVGALATSLIVTPFDVVKTRIQAQDTLQGSTGGEERRMLATKHHPGCVRGTLCTGLVHRMCSYCQNWFTLHSGPRLHGTMDGLITLARTEGPRTLWSGLQPTLVMSVPSTVLYFTAYDELKGALDRGLASTPLAPAAPLLAGTVARSSTVVAIAPLELVRTQMQAQRSRLGAVVGALGGAVREHGARSLFRGLFPTLLRDVPFSALYWMGYETIKRAITPCAAAASAAEGGDVPAGSDGSSTFLRAFAAGAGSGMVAAAVTTPFDVVKTRMQADIFTASASGTSAGGAVPPGPAAASLTLSQQSRLTAQLLRSIVRHEGPRALFAGLTARVAKVAPACAIMIGSYEYAKYFFLREA
mmetsp:Transcript_28437/g.92140  ORF Transcript_28437/g.92140 Transcript_28437/m.92140 type:complete len:376 (-) Transcript_28437:2069-3196(-)